MSSENKHIEEDTETTRRADELSNGDEIRINDRSRTLTVFDRHENPVTKVHRRGISERDHYDVVELEGNGTEYHLLYRYGSGSGPMLRSRSEWTEVEEDGETRYDYSGGERVEHLEIVNR